MNGLLLRTPTSIHRGGVLGSELQGGGQILHRHARRVSKIVGCAQRKDAKRTLLWETRTVSRGEYLVDCAVTAAGYDTADFACAGVGNRVSR